MALCGQAVASIIQLERHDGGRMVGAGVSELTNADSGTFQITADNPAEESDI